MSRKSLRGSSTPPAANPAIISEFRVPAGGLAFAWLDEVFRLRPIDRPSGRYIRGFTLVELMVVVVIITALTALALPSIVKQMRDRRTSQTAEEIAAIYRQARLRAMGRGSAVRVSYTSSGAQAGFTTQEAILNSADNCNQMPVSSCSATSWTLVNTTTQGPPGTPGTTWDVPSSISRQVSASGTDGNGVAPGDSTYVSVCFTPMGTTQFRTDALAAFRQMIGVPLVEVKATDGGGLTRYVLIPPNGLARTDVATK